jgi:acyl dehydratase
MSVVSGDFDTAVVGRSFRGDPVTVTAERIAAYAAATNETARLAATGEVAPPAFAYTSLRPPLRAALRAVTPLYDALQGLHGEQDIHVLAPVTPGMRLTPVIEVAGLQPRGTGVAVVLHARVLAGDDPVSEQYTTIYFRGAALEERLGAEAPDHRLAADVTERPPDGVVARRIDPDQPARYAEASGDLGAYHLDADAARRVGLPGIIVHGMCLMALAGGAVAEHGAGGDPARVRRLAVRFARPVLPGQELTTAIWELGRDDAVVRYGFESSDAGGVTVLRHGRAELGTA